MTTRPADGNCPPKVEGRLMTDHLFKDQALKALVPLTVAVAHESMSQILRWGVQEHTVAEWAVILAEEAGELQKEMCEFHFALKLPETRAKADKLLGIRLRLYREAIQEATLALKVAEMLGEPDGE